MRTNYLKCRSSAKAKTQLVISAPNFNQPHFLEIAIEGSKRWGNSDTVNNQVDKIHHLSSWLHWVFRRKGRTSGRWDEHQTCWKTHRTFICSTCWIYPLFHPSFPHILVKSNAGLFLKSWIFFFNYLFIIAIYDFSMAILKNSTQTYCKNYRKSWNMQHHLANYNKNLTRQRMVLRKKWRSINIIDFLQGFLRKIKDNHGFCKKSKNQLDNR